MNIFIIRMTVFVDAMKYFITVIPKILLGKKPNLVVKHYNKNILSIIIKIFYIIYYLKIMHGKK